MSDDVAPEGARPEAHGLDIEAPGERPFVVRGAPRGVHGLTIDGAEVHYRARLSVDGELPLLLLQHRSSRETPPDGFGPEVSVGAFAFDRHFVVRSESLSLPSRIFDRPGPLSTVGGVVGYLERLEVRPDREGTLLTLEVRVGRSRTRLDDAWRFAEACLEAADLAAAQGRRLDDARAAVASLGETATPEERVEALVKHVTDATHWLTGYAARVMDSVEVRLVLTDAGREHRGVLRLAWDDPAVAQVSIRFEGDLPTRRGPLSLRPQPGGLLGLITGWGEQVIGDDPLDDAFIIRGELAAGPVLLRARGRFLELGRRGATVDLGEALSVSIAAVPNETDLVTPTIDAILEVWRSTCRFCLGLE